MEADRACHRVLLNIAISMTILLLLELKILVKLMLMVITVAALIEDVSRRTCLSLLLLQMWREVSGLLQLLLL